MDGWAGEDVNIFIKEEFDFQKNLDMFDKAKVFAEIRVKLNYIHVHTHKMKLIRYNRKPMIQHQRNY